MNVCHEALFFPVTLEVNLLSCTQLRFLPKTLNFCRRFPESTDSQRPAKGHRKGKTMKEKGSYDRTKFVEQAQAAEEQRLIKEEEWNKKNEAWIRDNGSIPFQVPQLIFDGK
jgi:hypothetical protein